MKAGKAKQEKVIFRKWNDGDVIALFPEIAVDMIGYNCQSYIHVGQHGAASPDIVTSDTKPASPDEYKPLYDELIRLGYDLKVIKRFRYSHLKIRMAQCKSFSSR